MSGAILSLMEILKNLLCPKSAWAHASDVFRADTELATYNLDRLIDISAASPFGFIEAIDDWIKKYGGYTATIVLVIWVGKGLLWIALVFNTTVREGRHVAAALLYAMCCGSLYKTGKIRNQTARQSPNGTSGV